MGESEPLEQARSFTGVIDVLEAISAIYAIWGGLSVVAYGEPRFTMDMDILLSPTGFLAARFVQRLTESNYHIDEIAVSKALVEGGYFNAIDLHTHIKTDFYVPHQDPLLQRALNERVYLPYDEFRQAAYISVTAAIITKLRAYGDSGSTRHLEDIASIVRVQGNKIEAAEIDLYAAQLKQFGPWRRVWEENRP